MLRCRTFQGRSRRNGRSYERLGASERSWGPRCGCSDALALRIFGRRRADHGARRSRISSGFGHRFNEHGPVVDAVTPLGFEYALSIFSRGTTLGAFYFAKWFGGVAWLAAAAWLGQTIASEEGPARIDSEYWSLWRSRCRSRRGAFRGWRPESSSRLQRPRCHQARSGSSRRVSLQRSAPN